MKFDDENLMAIPFGRTSEKVQNRRYDWNNADRGTEAFVIFQYTIRGTGAFSLGGREYLVPAGHAFVALVPEASRYYYPEPNRGEWVFSWINFYGDFAMRLWGSLRERIGPVFVLAPPFFRLLDNLIARARKRAWRNAYDASEHGYRFYLEVLRHLRLPKRRAPKRLAQSIAHLRNHYHEDLRMKEVAALAGMSREHFTRLFLQQTGSSPAAFLRQIRVKAAARLIRTTNLPVAEIAFRCGFASATKLGLFFKRQYRVSPAAYRKGRAASGS